MYAAPPATVTVAQGILDLDPALGLVHVTGCVIQVLDFQLLEALHHLQHGVVHRQGSKDGSSTQMVTQKEMGS